MLLRRGRAPSIRAPPSRRPCDAPAVNRTSAVSSWRRSRGSACHYVGWLAELFVGMLPQRRGRRHECNAADEDDKNLRLLTPRNLSVFTPALQSTPATSQLTVAGATTPTPIYRPVRPFAISSTAMRGGPSHSPAARQRCPHGSARRPEPAAIQQLAGCVCSCWAAAAAAT